MSTQTLDSLCSINPETLGAATPMDMEFRYLDISAVTKGQIDWSTTKLWKYADAPSRARRRLHSRDVLLCTVRPGLQAHARIQQEVDAPLVGSTGFAVLRPNLAADSGFVFHQIFSDSVAAQLRALETGSSYPAVNEGDVRRVRVFCPEKEERWRIAAVLDTVDEAITKTEAVIAKLRQVRAGLLHDLLTRGLDNNGQLRDPIAHREQFQPSPLGQIPKEWTVCLLDDVASRGSGHTPSKDVPSYWNGGIKWVSLADSDKLDRIYISETDKEISDLGIENSSAVKHPAGTVILSRDAGIGKSAILAQEMAVSQHFMAWRCGKRLHNVYLYYWVQDNKPRFEAIAMGSTIKTIGLSYFKRLKIAVPPIEEQRMAANAMLASEATLTAEEVELRKLHQLKSGLMTDLLTGRVRVPISQSKEQAYGTDK